MSRAKGSRFERSAAQAILAVDGHDAVYRHIATTSGRVGHLDVGADIVTRRFAVECKHRENLSNQLWTWLAGIRVPNKLGVLLIKRNREEPLVLLSLDSFLQLIGDHTGHDSPPTDTARPSDTD